MVLLKLSITNYFSWICIMQYNFACLESLNDYEKIFELQFIIAFKFKYMHFL